MTKFKVHGSGATKYKAWLKTVGGLVQVSANHTPPMPNPVSHFDFHEGSGNTITDIIGGKVLTSSSPNWVTGGAKGTFSGAEVGPTGDLNNWSAIFDITVDTDFDGGILSIGHAASSNPWFNYNISQVPGPWPPDQFGSVGMGLNTKARVVFTFAPGECKTYVNGALSGTFANSHPVSFSNPGGGTWVIQGTVIGFATIHAVRFYNVTLTPEQIAGFTL